MQRLHNLHQSLSCIVIGFDIRHIEIFEGVYKVRDPSIITVLFLNFPDLLPLLQICRVNVLCDKIWQLVSKKVGGIFALRSWWNFCVVGFLGYVFEFLFCFFLNQLLYLHSALFRYSALVSMEIQNNWLSCPFSKLSVPVRNRTKFVRLGLINVYNSFVQMKLKSKPILCLWMINSNVKTLI